MRECVGACVRECERLCVSAFELARVHSANVRAYLSVCVCSCVPFSCARLRVFVHVTVCAGERACVCVFLRAFIRDCVCSCVRSRESACIFARVRVCVWVCA